METSNQVGEILLEVRPLFIALSRKPTGVTRASTYENFQGQTHHKVREVNRGSTEADDC